ncbi:hypothetical protein [Ornithinimicrobium kibberense]|uniref:hypothetical protein n=1 Tax=Ornithinimicrobium kibberense TaxID=282060 RepID=UPI00360EEB85
MAPSRWTSRTCHRSPFLTQDPSAARRVRSLRRVITVSPALASVPSPRATSRPEGCPVDSRRSVRARWFSSRTVSRVAASSRLDRPACWSAAQASYAASTMSPVSPAWTRPWSR